MDQAKKLIKGIKIGMSQIFTDDGICIPVTKIKSFDEITLDLEQKPVQVTGTSKGKGFAGAMKKWNFHGQMATRGQSDKPRAPGSIGGQTPGRVFKGKKMAGRMGNQTVSISGLRIVKIFIDTNEILVSGPIPGSRNSAIKIKVLA